MLENFPQYGKAFAMRLVTSQIRATQTTWSLNCGNLVYHHTPDCNECFFLHFSERPACVCWIWRNGETSKVKLTHRIPMPPVDASKYKPHTKAAKSTHCIISLSGKSDAMSIGLCLQFRLCTMPSYDSYVSGTHALAAAATLLDRTFPGSQTTNLQ